MMQKRGRPTGLPLAHPGREETRWLSIGSRHAGPGGGPSDAAAAAIGHQATRQVEITRKLHG